MRSIKYLVPVGALLLLVLTGCKKYDEGPAISLKSKKARVANTWIIDKAYSKGVDVTKDYDEFILKTTVDGDATLAALYSIGAFSFEYETNGTWQFENNKENIAFDYKNDAADKTYQILKLEIDNMWLREKGGEDELHLKAK